MLAYGAGAGLSYVASQDDSAVGRYGGSAINGAMLGASVGSFIPVVGTGVGAGVGAGLGLLYEYLNQPDKQAQEPAKVETTVRVELADGLKATHQTSDKKGPVSAWVETGSVWGHP
jgi:phage tail tape-measure protein